jgi:hypothetical protein
MSADESVEPDNIVTVALPPLEAAIVILSTDHSVLSGNPCAEGLTGYSIEALKATGLAQVFGPAAVIRLYDFGIRAPIPGALARRPRLRRSRLGLSGALETIVAHGEEGEHPWPIS